MGLLTAHSKYLLSSDVKSVIFRKKTAVMFHFLHQRPQVKTKSSLTSSLTTLFIKLKLITQKRKKINGRPYYHRAVAALKSLLPRGLLYKLYNYKGQADEAGVPSLICMAPCVSVIDSFELSR